MNQGPTVSLSEQPNGGGQNSGDLLSAMPVDIIGVVVSFLEITDAIRLAATCKNMRRRVLAAPKVLVHPDYRTNLLFDIIKYNFNHQWIRKVVRGGAWVDARDGRNMTPLYVSVWYGNDLFVYELIAAGADVNCRSSHGKLPLILASYHRHDSCLRHLIAAGARLDEVDDAGDTALLVAIIKNYEYGVYELAAAGANVNLFIPEMLRPTSLLQAAYYGHDSLLRILIAFGADVNVVNYKRETALMIAKQQNHHSCVEILRAAGAQK